jgi:DNA invertase Pin-like site-specific DNA recombinase
MNKPTRVAIYARVSTADQNPEAQLVALREYASQRGFTTYKEYVDHVTGSHEDRGAERSHADTAYRQLMEDVGKRAVDCVLVWKYDRLARSLGVLIAALQRFSSLGVDFISYTQNIDTTTPMGRLFYHIIGSFAEFEREMIVERVRAGLNNAKAKGKILGRPLKDQTASPRIVALRAQGMSLREIARREKRSASGILQILRRTEDRAGRPKS